MRRVVVALMFVAMALAGCSQPVDDGPGADDGDPRVMELPKWKLGEFWTFEIDTPGFETETAQLVYAWDKDNYTETRGWVHHMLGAPRDHAVFHAVFDVNPFIGRIHSDVLSPHEDGLHSSIFDFPLEPPGETWQEKPDQVFFGKSRSYESTYAEDVPSPSGPTEGYRIVATGPNGSEVRYNYVPEVKWFTKLVAVDENGDEFVRMELKDHGKNAQGKKYFVRPRVLGTIDKDVSTGVDQQETFEVYEHGDYGNFEYLAIGIRVSPQGDVGRVDLEISDPDGQTRKTLTVESDQGTSNQLVEIPPAQGRDSPKPGTWTVSYDVVNDAHLWLEANGAWEFCGKDGQKMDCP